MKTITNSLSIQILIKTLAIVVISLFLAVICALGWVQLALIVFLVLIWIVGLLLFSLIGWHFKEYLLLTLIAMFFFGNLIQSNTGVPISLIWQGLILIIGLFGIAHFGRFALDYRVMKLSFIFFILFLTVCVVSAFYTGYSNKESFLSQFVSDWKLIFFMSLGVFLLKEIDFLKWIDRVIPIYIVIATLFLLMQWTLPGVYQQLFAGIQLHDELDSGFGLSRGQSLFSHSSHFAGVSALLAIFPLTKILLKAEVSISDYVKLFLLFLFVIAAQQRQELMSFIVVAALIYLMGSKVALARKLSTVAIVTTASLALYLIMFWSVFDAEFASWGIGSNVHAITHPRALLYDGAFDLAKDNFPFGAGMGTYGGVGSMKYNLAVYFKLGFSKAWWWKDYANYLVDTYWPNSIGEAGFIGASFLLLHYVLIVFFGVNKVSNSQLSESQTLLWFSFLAAFSWLLLTTPTSPGFQEALLLFIPSLYFGAAVAKEKNKGIK